MLLLHTATHTALPGRGREFPVKVGTTRLLGKEVVRLLSPEHQVIGASRTGSDLSVDLADKAGHSQTV